MNFKLISITVFYIIFSSVFLNAETKSKTIVFQVAHGPYEVINEPLQIFKKEVEEKTNGQLKVQIKIPDNLKKTNIESVKKTFTDVQSGKIQMSQLYTYYMSKFDPNFLALEIPYLFKDHDHSFSAVDGEPGKDLLASLEKNSPLKGLGFTYCGGYRSIASIDLKLEKIEDFSKIKMISQTPVTKIIFTEMGGLLVDNISKENTLSALTKNEINAFETVSPRYFHSGEYLVARVLNDLNHNIQFTTIVINKKFFYSLTKQQQKIISEAASKASLVERTLAIKIAANVRDNAKTYGILVVKMPEIEINKFKDIMSKVDWFGKLGISKDFVDKIKRLETKKLSSNSF